MVTVRDGVWFLVLLGMACAWYADHSMLTKSNAGLRSQLGERIQEIDYLKARLSEANKRLRPVSESQR